LSPASDFEVLLTREFRSALDIFTNGRWGWAVLGTVSPNIEIADSLVAMSNSLPVFSSMSPAGPSYISILTKTPTLVRGREATM
jgi:hypothetical protein